MTKKYLELDSVNRNRTQDPGPGSFSVPLSQSGMNNKWTAVDPVSDAYPTLAFRIVDERPFQTIVPAYGIRTIGNAATNLNTSSVSKFIVSILGSTQPGGNRLYPNNYFVGAPVSFNDAGPPIVASASRITEWIYMSTVGTTDLYSVAVDLPLPSSIINVATTLVLNQMSNITGTVGQVFIPGSQSTPNLYKGYYLLNQTASSNPQYTTITGFDKDTHLATTSTRVNNWTASDVIVLRKSLPLSYKAQYYITS